jgi:hypothetical protein
MPMTNIYLKNLTVLKTKKKNSELKKSSLDFILKYSSSIEALSSSNKIIIFSKN